MTEQEKQGKDQNINFCDGCKYYSSDVVHYEHLGIPYFKVEQCMRFDKCLTYKKRLPICIERHIKEEENHND